MFGLFGLCFGAIRRTFRTHRSLMLENLALRQQLAVLKRKHPRPRLVSAAKSELPCQIRCSTLSVGNYFR